MLDDIRTVFCLPLSYSRHGEVMQGLADTCDRCEQRATVISIDTSDAEYGSISLCKPCILALFDPPPKVCQHDLRKGEFDRYEFCLHCGESAYRIDRAANGAD